MERKKIGQIQGRISRGRLVRNPTVQYIIINLLTNMTTLACTVSQKSLTKNYIIQSMERKKIGQVQGRISRRRLVCNPTIQHIIINLHTKYEYSSLHSFREIFDEIFHHLKYGKKENWTNTGKNKQGKAGSQSHGTIHHYQLAHQYDYSSLHSFTEIFDEKFHHSKYGKKENWTNTRKNKQEKAGLQFHNTTCHHQSVYQI